MSGNDDGDNQYIPGNCNLGAAEIRRRYRIGFIGLAVSVLIILIFSLSDSPRLWRLLIFMPVFYSVSGFIQAANKFCYVYGFRHVFSTKGLKRFSRITDMHSKEKDKAKATRIVLIVTACSLLITMLYYFI